MTFEHYYSAAWQDITDYVTAVDMLPRLSRNRDFSLRAEYNSFSVAVTIRDSATYPDDFTFTDGDRFRLKDDSGTVIWNGELEKSKFNYSKDEFEIRAKSLLMKLKEIKVDYATFHTALAAGSASQFWTDYLTYNSVQVLWALQNAFTLAGLTLNVPAGLLSTNLFTRPEFDSGIGADDWGVTITFADLYFDEGELYCMGNSVATDHTTIDNEEYAGGVISGFALASEILMALQLCLVSYGDEGYSLEHNTGNYTIADDDKFEYDEEEVSKEDVGIGFNYASVISSGSWVITSSNRDRFYNVAVGAISQYGSGKGDRITPIVNFRILFADAKGRVGGFTDAYCESVCEPDLSETLIIDDTLSTAHINIIAGRYADKALDHTVETILTDYESTFETIEEHYVDPEWKTSEIIQEL